MSSQVARKQVEWKVVEEAGVGFYFFRSDETWVWTKDAHFKS